MKTRTVGAVAAASLIAAGAQAVNVLQFDIDALSAQASGGLPFSDTFTGSLHVFSAGDANAVFLEVLIDGNAQNTGGATAGNFDFDMTISFVGGVITGGAMSVAVDATGSENTYTASLSPGAGTSILDIGGGIFIIGGLTFNGMFANPAGTILGVDISPWGGVQPLSGNFAQFAFNPDASGFDANTDVDVFILIPLPGAVGMATLGLLGLGTIRRRRAVL